MRVSEAPRQPAELTRRPDVDRARRRDTVVHVTNPLRTHGRAAVICVAGTAEKAAVPAAAEETERP